MSYLAIARKYRPTTFAEIVGQDHVTRTLQNAIARSRIHHAYLFCGARGVGKTTAARALARSLNCVAGPTSTPCGECPSCLEIGAGTSPDLIEIDGASNNSVDDIRELRETVRYAPTQGKWKLYLVDEVHMLSRAAFNALLKTLEEPPPHIVFIFATTEPNKIPDTILSRVQRFDFKRIPMAGVVERLNSIAINEGATVSPSGLRMIARAGEGSMRDAQSLLDKVISFSVPDENGNIPDAQVAETLGLIDRSLLYNMLDGLVNGAPDACFGAIEQVYSYGYELSQFTGEMLEVVRNATFVCLSKEARERVDLPKDEVDRIDTITSNASPEALARTFHALLEVHDTVSRASRPRIVLEMAVARLADNRPVQPVGALVGRLEDMERRLRNPGRATSGTAATRNRSRSTRSPSTDGTESSRDDRPRPAAGPSEAQTPAVVRTSTASATPQVEQRPAGQQQQQRPKTQPKPSITRASLQSEASPGNGAPPADPSASNPGAIANSANPKASWSALCSDLKRAGGAAARLTTGSTSFADDTLTIEFVGTHRLLEAQRVVADERFTAMLTRHYPTDTRINLVSVAPEGVDTTVTDLKQLALAHPGCQRIIEVLDGRLSDVVASGDPNE